MVEKTAKRVENWPDWKTGKPVAKAKCLRCGGDGQRSQHETLNSPGYHPCPGCNGTGQRAEGAEKETPDAAG